MKIWEIPTTMSIDALCCTRNLAPPDSFFVVDPDHADLCSVNGSVYSKDMTILYAIAPCLTDYYLMPSSVVEVAQYVVFHQIKQVVVSPNLQKMSGLSFLKGQQLDLRDTKFDYCTNSMTTLVDEAVCGNIHLPERKIRCQKHSYVISKYAITKSSDDYDGTTLVAVINLDHDSRKNYIVPRGVEKIFLNDIPVTFIENVYLPPETMKIGGCILETDMIGCFVADKDHPIFFNYENCLYAKNDDGGYSLIWTPKKMKSLHILEGTTIIKRSACFKMQAEEIIFPESLQTIEQYAFFKCSLSSDLDLRKTKVKDIGRGTFEGLQANNVYLPQCCTKLSDDCMSRAKFHSINLQDTAIEHIGHFAFFYTAFEKIQLPATTTTCLSSAFQSVKAQEVDLSHTSIVCLQTSLFKDSDIQSIKLPKNIINILPNAFGCSKTKSIKLENDEDVKVMICSEAFYNSDIQEFEAPTANIIQERAFAGCTKLQRLVLANECIAKPSAFNKCPKAIKQKFK